MRWDEKFPTAEFDAVVPGEMVYRSGVIGKCFMCDRRTSWIDIGFEGHLCSEECSQAAWDDIAKRTQEAASKQTPSF